MSKAYVDIIGDVDEKSKRTQFYTDFIYVIMKYFYRIKVVTRDRCVKKEIKKALKNTSDDILRYGDNVKVLLYDKNTKRFDLEPNYSYTIHIILLNENPADKDGADLCENSMRNVFVDTYTYKTVAYDREEIRKIVESVVILRNRFFNKPSTVTDDTVVVVDLDNTLIDDGGNLIIADINTFFSKLSSYFNRRVLWSHGAESHVKTYVKKYELQKYFDIIIYRCDDETLTEKGIYLSCQNKGFGKVMNILNNRYNTIQVKYTCLIDDIKENNAGDYTFAIIVPRLTTWCEYEKFYNCSINKLSNKIRKL